MYFSLRFAVRLHQQQRLQLQQQRRAPVLNCLQVITAYLSTLKLELNGKTQIFPFKNGVSYLGFHTYITPEGRPIRKLKNQNKRNAQREFHRMAKLVAEGKLPAEKFQASYCAWKNHISHGNCHKLGVTMDETVNEILNNGREENETDPV